MILFLMRIIRRIFRLLLVRGEFLFFFFFFFVIVQYYGTVYLLDQLFIHFFFSFMSFFFHF